MSISATQSDLTALDERYQMNADALTDHIRQRFGGSLLSLRQLEPFIREILRRFKRLPRRTSVDGSLPTISGHRTFTLWCAGVLKRSDRTVRYMLKGGNLKRKKPNVETVSTLSAVPSKHIPSERILKYLDQQLSTASKSKRRFLVQEISQTIDRFKGDPRG